MDDEEFFSRLLATFRIEAGEHLEAMSSGLIQLKRLSPKAAGGDLVEVVFREAHSLKGAARAVNFQEIESACQAFENVFSAMKQDQEIISVALCELLLECVDEIGKWLGAEEARKPSVQALVERLENVSSNCRLMHQDGISEASQHDFTQLLPEVDPDGESRSNTSGTVRVSSERLKGVMHRAEEMVTSKQAGLKHIQDLRELDARFSEGKKRMEEVRLLVRRFVNKEKVEPKKVEKLMASLDTQKRLDKSVEGSIKEAIQSAEKEGRQLATKVDELLADVCEMLMMPFDSMSDGFQRFIREMARQQGKKIELSLLGGQIEIDKRILDELKDPILHLLRNSVDHGIEPPSVRKRKQKSPEGKIMLSLAQKGGGKVEIAVADDGSGIDRDKLVEAGHRLGLLRHEKNDGLEAGKVLSLVFHSGVSTSQMITDISGRGLGLAIVQEKVERLGGRVEVESILDSGTTFRLEVPLTLATFKGILVSVDGHHFIFPLHQVERVARVARSAIQTLENREAIEMDGQPVSLARLGAVLELPARSLVGDPVPLIVLGRDSSRIAFVVDAIHGEQEIVVKPLGRQLARVKNINGACLLGSGEVVPVLNPQDLLKSAVRQLSSSLLAAEKPGIPCVHKILVVEDSITARTLLKNILESVGYTVVTAVDGIDALNRIKTDSFDLVVSDVDMPRMNGFELTSQIRADSHLAELPVVLVTALGSSEHRERGNAVGASAYIVKSSFDQTGLLDVIGRLI
ncbi:MAG TPA: response regulator [Burkholderiales bacterium]|nr:response regulator [Burkholderiales bacterium]